MGETATVLGTRLGVSLGTSVGVGGTPESRLLARLGTIPNSVWLDTAWEDGVVTEDDGGTMRVTSVLSRPIHAQYTVSQGTVSIGPAAVLSPNGKQIFSFSGAQFLFGAPALAALFQGSSPYSSVSLASANLGSTRVRFGFALNAASPDNRIQHYISAAGNVNGRARTQAGAGTGNTGAAIPAATVQVHSTTYSGANYSAWINGVAETLSPSNANVRAPAALDDFQWGCIRSGGTPAAFWSGLQTGLILVPGAVISDDDREALESDLAAYYGYTL